MKRLHGSQLHIRTLMLLIGAIACALALVQWVGILLAITIGVFLASLVAEAIMSKTHPVPRSQPSRVDARPNAHRLDPVRLPVRDGGLFFMLDRHADGPFSPAIARLCVCTTRVGARRHESVVIRHVDPIWHILAHEFLPAPLRRARSSAHAVHSPARPDVGALCSFLRPCLARWFPLSGRLVHAGNRLDQLRDSHHPLDLVAQPPAESHEDRRTLIRHSAPLLVLRIRLPLPWTIALTRRGALV